MLFSLTCTAQRPLSSDSWSMLTDFNFMSSSSCVVLTYFLCLVGHVYADPTIWNTVHKLLAFNCLAVGAEGPYFMGPKGFWKEFCCARSSADDAIGRKNTKRDRKKNEKRGKKKKNIKKTIKAPPKKKRKKKKGQNSPRNARKKNHNGEKKRA